MAKSAHFNTSSNVQQMLRDSLARYQRESKPKPRKPLSLSQKLEKAEIALGSALGMLKNDPTPERAKAYNEAVCAAARIREQMGVSNYGDARTHYMRTYPLPTISGGEQFLPAGFTDFTVLDNGMVCLELADLIKFFSPYTYDDKDWSDKYKKGCDMAMDFLNAIPYLVYVWNYDKPWNMEDMPYTEYDMRRVKQVEGVKIWIRHYSS